MQTRHEHFGHHYAAGQWCGKRIRGAHLRIAMAPEAFRSSLRGGAMAPGTFLSSLRGGAMALKPFLTGRCLLRNGAGSVPVNAVRRSNSAAIVRDEPARRRNRKKTFPAAVWGDVLEEVTYLATKSAAFGLVVICATFAQAWEKTVGGFAEFLLGVEPVVFIGATHGSLSQFVFGFGEFPGA